MNYPSQRTWVGLGLFWTLVIVLFAWHQSQDHLAKVLDTASVHAKASIDKDLVYRHWVASHGGVYVPVTETTPPNPYLGVPERDIETPAGGELTLINPAYMTRQVLEMDKSRYGVRGHITSLNPLRPENTPDPWETSALKSFETGSEEVSEQVEIDGVPFLRMMVAMPAEEPCLTCHAKQGYQLGDVRGGLSVSVPLEPYLAIHRADSANQSMYYAGVWLLGVIGLLAARSKVARPYRILEETLKKSQQQQDLFEKSQQMGHIGTWMIDMPSNRLEWTDEVFRIFDVPPSTPLNYQRFLERLHPEDRDEVDRAWQAARRGAKYDIEHRVITGSGVRWVREKADLSFDAHGELVSAIGFAQDITEQKLEAAINAAHLRLVDYAREHEVKELLTRFLDEAELLTESRAGFYHFVDEPSGTLKIQAWSSQTAGVMCRIEKFESHYPVAAAGVWADCVRQRRPIVHNDYAALPNKRGFPEGHAPIVRELVVPVLRDEVIIAVLGVGNKPIDYTERDVQTLQRLADFAWEIIERKHAEEALQESEARFKAMFHNHDAVMLLVDPDTGAIVDANSSACRFYGYAFEQLTSLSFDQINTLSSAELTVVRRQAASGEKNHFEFTHRLADGRIRSVEVHSSPISVVGKLLLFSIVHDVTEQVQARRALADNEHKYRALFDEAGHGTAVADAESGIILSCNRKLSEMVGRPVEEIVGQHQSFLHPAESGEGEFTETYKIHRDAKTGKVFEATLLTREGKLVPVEIAAARLQLGEQSVIQGFFYDISERKKLQEEQARSAQLAALGTVAAGVAHEINNPIQGIMNFATLIHKKPELVERNGEMAQRIVDESLRVAKITRDLLFYAKDSRLDLSPVEARGILDGALSLVRTKFRHHGIELALEVQEDLGKVILQPQSIQQVVLNLVDNAFDALHFKPTTGEKLIRVKGEAVERDGVPLLLLEVSDNGIGMPEEVRSKAQQAFFTTKPGTEGTGLGLSIVGDIVAKHQGRLEIESREGEGTSVRIFLPLLR